MANDAGNRTSPPQRWVLPVLVVMFLGPLAAAWYFYFAGDSWRPGSSVNHGQLIDPAVPLQLDDISALDDAQGQWLLLVDAGESCDPACVAVLDKVRRVRLALRNKAPRVGRVLLHGGTLSDSDAMREQREGLLTVQRASDGGHPLGRQLEALAPARVGGPAVFIVDPLGNAVLVFTPDFAMRGMLADLKRLLKLSRIG